MQRGKRLDVAVLWYLFSILVFVIFNLSEKVRVFDLLYLFVVLCCSFKYFMIVFNRK